MSFCVESDLFITTLPYRLNFTKKAWLYKS
jgi:hypothetical protein